MLRSLKIITCYIDETRMKEGARHEFMCVEVRKLPLVGFGHRKACVVVSFAQARVTGGKIQGEKYRQTC